MARFRPLHALLAVGLFIGAVLVAEWALEARTRAASQRVKAGGDGLVKVDVANLQPGKVRFYDYLNPGNQEVRFLVARDKTGALQVAFDAAENDYKRHLGFRQEGEWLVNNKCDTAVRLEEVNAGTSGCRPTPLKHQVVGQTVVLAESDVLAGWRYFH